MYIHMVVDVIQSCDDHVTSLEDTKYMYMYLVFPPSVPPSLLPSLLPSLRPSLPLSPSLAGYGSQSR